MSHHWRVCAWQANLQQILCRAATRSGLGCVIAEVGRDEAGVGSHTSRLVHSVPFLFLWVVGYKGKKLFLTIVKNSMTNKTDPPVTLYSLRF